MENKHLSLIPLAQANSLLTRDKEGNKIINDKPIGDFFTQQWTPQQTSTMPQDRPVLIHTGNSNILAIDFDSELWYQALNLNEQLADKYKCTAISQSIGKTGGHLLYNYTNNQLTDYINSPNGKKKHKLDVLYGETLVFASNDANKTKQVLTDTSNNLTQLADMPLPMQLLCINHYMKHEKPTSNNQHQTSNHQGSKLGTLASEALNNEKYLTMLLGIITTKEYKDILAQSTKTMLVENHPDRLPAGESGHMYLLSLANVLRVDPSISRDVYTQLVYKINNMFTVPLKEDRVKVQIINPDLKSFVYDDKWKERSFIVTNRDDEPLEVFKFTAQAKNKFIIYNAVSHKLIEYDSVVGVIDYLASESTARSINRNNVIQRAQHIDIIDRPDIPFGYSFSDKTFNLYKWNHIQEVFYNPTPYKAKYKKPETILKAIEAAVGQQAHTLFLPFLKRKLMTRDHSGIFFVLYGVPHSFKSGLFNALLAPFTPRRNAKLSLAVLIDKYNDWQVNRDFILLDEIHHYIKPEIAQMIKVVNETTGNEEISGVRAMHKSLNSDTYPQEMTIFLTTNEIVQLTTEAADRRMVVFESMYKLSDSLKMSNEAIKYNIRSEIMDFAYYLATEVKELEGDAYTSNNAWKSPAYYNFLEASLSVEDALIKQLDSEQINELLYYCIELGHTVESIRRCIYHTPKGDITRLRLSNSQENKAELPGIFDSLTMLDIKKIKKKLRLIPTVMVDRVEYMAGSSERTGSKKTEIILNDIDSVFTTTTKNEIQDEGVDLNG